MFLVKLGATVLGNYFFARTYGILMHNIMNGECHFFRLCVWNTIVFFCKNI